MARSVFWVHLLRIVASSAFAQVNPTSVLPFFHHQYADSRPMLPERLKPNTRKMLVAARRSTLFR